MPPKHIFLFFVLKNVLLLFQAMVSSQKEQINILDNKSLPLGEVLSIQLEKFSEKKKNELILGPLWRESVRQRRLFGYIFGQGLKPESF